MVREGLEADFFESVDSQVDNGLDDADRAEQELPALAGNDLQENINCMQAEGLGVDDDNEPAPENLPNPQDEPVEQAQQGPGDVIYYGWNSRNARKWKTADHGTAC